MSKRDEDRFTTPPQVYIGEDLVHDPDGGETPAMARKLKEAEDRNVEDARGTGRAVLDALRRKWSRR
jgi:hypothetical protein